MVTADEIFASLRSEFMLEPAEEPRGSAPAELFTVDGGPHTVGVIASVTRPFCGDCDRVRLTADGQVRNCLFAREESDLRAALRGGADDAEIADRWRVAMLGKRPGHGIDDVSFLQPARPMSAIGGCPPAPYPAEASDVLPNRRAAAASLRVCEGSGCRAVRSAFRAARWPLERVALRGRCAGARRRVLRSARSGRRGVAARMPPGVVGHVDAGRHERCARQVASRARATLSARSWGESR